MSDCRFGVSPVNYPDPDPDVIFSREPYLLKQLLTKGFCHCSGTYEGWTRQQWRNN